MYQARELVAQRNILGDEICTVFEDGSDGRENQRQLEGHLTDHTPGASARRKLAIPRPYPIMTRHSDREGCAGPTKVWESLMKQGDRVLGHYGTGHRYGA